MRCWKCRRCGGNPAGFVVDEVRIIASANLPLAAAEGWARRAACMRLFLRSKYHPPREAHHFLSAETVTKTQHVLVKQLPEQSMIYLNGWWQPAGPGQRRYWIAAPVRRWRGTKWFRVFPAPRSASMSTCAGCRPASTGHPAGQSAEPGTMARIDPAGDRAAGFRRPAGVCAGTRGCGPNRDFPFPDPVQPSTLIYPMPLITASAELKAQGRQRHQPRGLSLAAATSNRWRCWPMLLRNEALAQGCAETVLLRDGWLTEGAATISSRSRTACCARPSQLMLSGITLRRGLDWRPTIYPCEVRPISDSELRAPTKSG